MLDRSYVACWIAKAAKRERGDDPVITICDAWGTTFFGHDWFKNDGPSQNERNLHFYFAEHPG
jgi:hypothetical protein